ncbi:MFS transporter [Brucella pecoris]|nr:MFS transporter [Brucella pecoris]MBB4095869.1 MFS family permease [Brucella pecoris]
MEENASRDDQAARGGLGKRHLVFAIICLINFTIWLDEGVFAALTPYWAKELNLTPAQIGTGSAAYLLGYFPVLFLAGILSDRFGARRMLFICVIGCSILSAAMLWVHDYWTLFIRNILFGIFFGFLWAPCNKLLTSWMPAVERTRFAAIWFSSCMVSFVVAAPLALMMAEKAIWQDAFLLVTALGIPATLLLWFCTTEKPEEMKTISQGELNFIYEGTERRSLDSDFSWGKLGQILRQRSVLFMIVATCLATTPTWLIATWGFYQLINLYKIEGSSVSLYISLGYMVTVIYGFFHGWVFKTIFGGYCRPALAAGPVISGIGFLIAAYTSNPIVIAFALFAAGTLCNPFFWGTVNAYWGAVAKPEFSGTLNGISAAGQVIGGYIILSLSGGWVQPVEVAGIRALDTVWLVGGIVFLLTVIPIYLAKEVRISDEAPSTAPAAAH